MKRYKGFINGHIFTIFQSDQYNTDEDEGNNASGELSDGDNPNEEFFDSSDYLPLSVCDAESMQLFKDFIMTHQDEDTSSNYRVEYNMPLPTKQEIDHVCNSVAAIQATANGKETEVITEEREEDALDEDYKETPTKITNRLMETPTGIINIFWIGFLILGISIIALTNVWGFPGILLLHDKWKNTTKNFIRNHYTVDSKGKPLLWEVEFIPVENLDKHHVPVAIVTLEVDAGMKQQ